MSRKPEKKHWAEEGSRRLGWITALVVTAPIVVLLLLFLRACS